MINIGIINLMSNKLETEENFQKIFKLNEVNIQYLYFKTHHTKSQFDYEFNNYFPIDKYTYKQFDAFIFTGAPIDHLDFKNIDYINEFNEFISIITQNKIPTLYLCWSAMASMNHLYGIKKYPLTKKLFGVFQNELINFHPIINGFESIFYVPHARYYDLKLKDLNNISDIIVLSKTIDDNPTFWVNSECNAFYSLSHIEYDSLSLLKEYKRERTNKNENAIFPILSVDKNQKFLFNWKKEQQLFFNNFLSVIEENKNDN